MMSTRRWLRGSLFLAPLLAASLCAVGETAADESAEAAEDAQSRIEQQAADFVETALHFELEDDALYRDWTLKCALRIAPQFAPANWQLGRVQVEGAWLPVEKAQHQAASDAALGEYRQLRDEAQDDPNRHLAVARWCAKNDLQDRSQLHYAYLLHHPHSDGGVRKEAMRKLGLRLHQGALLTEEQIEQQQQVREQVAAAIKQWRPKFDDWRKTIISGKGKKLEVAMAEMQAVEDPQSIAALSQFVPDPSGRFAEQAIELLSRFEEHEASEALASFAVLSPNEQIRKLAAKRLSKRPLHEFVPLFLDLLETPIQSSFRLRFSWDGSVQYQHNLYREGRNENYAFKDEHTAIARNLQFRGTQPRNRNLPPGGISGGFNTGESEAKQVLAAAQAHLTEKRLARQNAAIVQRNQPVFAALETATGQPIVRNSPKWWDWWRDHNELYTPTKPTRYAYQSSYTAYLNSFSYHITGPSSCFIAGTPVWAETGLVAIETLQPGDRVLAQDVDRGELTYKTVLRVTLRPPAELMQLTLNGEAITATKGHPFWRADHGWRMAKLLKEGDQLHGLKGGLSIDAIEPVARRQPAYNLVVDEFHTYFVGTHGALVHDNVDRRPTTARLPGLLPQ